MYSRKYFEPKDDISSLKSVNVVELINKTRKKEKLERRKSVYLVLGAVSALVVCGFIVTL